MRGSTLRTSVIPTTATSELSATACKPAARISSPPRPKAARPGTRCRTPEINRAPATPPRPQLRDQPRAVKVTRGFAGDHQQLAGIRLHAAQGMGAGGPEGKGYIS